MIYRSKRENFGAKKNYVFYFIATSFWCENYSCLPFLWFTHIYKEICLFGLVFYDLCEVIKTRKLRSARWTKEHWSLSFYLHIKTPLCPIGTAHHPSSAEWKSPTPLLKIVSVRRHSFSLHYTQRWTISPKVELTCLNTHTLNIKYCLKRVNRLN